MPFHLYPIMWTKIFALFVGLLWGASLPLTSSQTGRDAILVCTVSGFYPEDMDIEWLRGDQSGMLYPFNEQPWTDRHGNTFGILRFDVPDFLEEHAFVCRVSHSESQAKVKSKVKKSEDKRNGLNENLRRANRKETSLHQAQTLLTSLVIGLNASEVSVQWVKDALNEGQPVNTQVLKDSSNGAHLAFSQMTVPCSDWNDGASYSCMFTRKAGTMNLTQRPEEKSRCEK